MSPSNPDDPITTPSDMVTSTDQTSSNNADIQEEETSSSSGDFFTYVLLAYLVFAVADTIFHFIPNDKTYVEMFGDVVRGVVGGDGP